MSLSVALGQRPLFNLSKGNKTVTNFRIFFPNSLRLSTMHHGRMNPVEHRDQPSRTRTSIIAGTAVVLGIVIAVSAHLFTSASDLCARESRSAIPATYGHDVYYEFTSTERIWSPLVGARCTAALADDLRFTVTVISWPATVWALSGLALTAVAALAWHRCRRSSGR